MMKLLFVAVMVGTMINHGFAQIVLPAHGGNKKASVSEWIGITEVKIDYNRPALKGREGKIWGEVVHYGFKQFGNGTSKASPWRAGANENTTIEFSTEVSIEGKKLPAGKYGFFIAMDSSKAMLIFSKANNAWGSFYYEPKDDALRVSVPLQKLAAPVERLKYEFDDQTDTSAVVSLKWEYLRIPFHVSVDLHKLQIESFRYQFPSGKFYVYWQNLYTAANYCLTNNVNLEEGLVWADRSVNSFFGEANFTTMSTYAGLLEKLNRKREADSVMQKALSLARPQELFMYGTSLNRSNKHQEAFKFHQMNLEKFPKDEYAYLSMMAGHYYLGETQKAIRFGEKGREVTDDAGFRGYFDALISDLKKGKAIFQ